MIADIHIQDQGDPVVNGCGWHIISDSGIDYIPKNLDDKLSFGGRPLNKLNEFPAINLTSIKKK